MPKFKLGKEEEKEKERIGAHLKPSLKKKKKESRMTITFHKHHIQWLVGIRQYQFVIAIPTANYTRLPAHIFDKKQ